MAIPAENNQIIRFATFEVDLRAGELRKGGVRLKLSGQPFQVLSILLEQPGEIVTREDLQKRLWPDTFVDVDHNLNTAINKIREALGDSADTPRFVETLPRRGYRFIAPVNGGGTAAIPAGEVTGAVRRDSVIRFPAWPAWSLFATFIVLVAIGLYVYSRRHHPTPGLQRTLTRITFDEGLQVGVTWSPDGRYIAYSSNRGGKFDIWVQQISGGDPVLITKGPGHNWQPDWSPDGKYIVYRSENGDGGLFVMPALGGAGMERRVAAFGYYPRWSPDGSKILFQTAWLGLPSKVFVVNLAEGDGPHEVLANVTALQNVISTAWHPDGKRISVWSLGTIPSPIPTFWTGSVESSSSAVKTEITPEVLNIAEVAAGRAIDEWAASDFKFCWAHSGKAIIFERTFRGARNIWRLMVDPFTLRATGAERLTTGAELEAEPALSPDGSKLAFTGEAEPIRAWVFPFSAVLGRVTGAGQAATSPRIEAWEASLSPDGKKLAIAGNQAGQWKLWESSLPNGREIPISSDDSYTRAGTEWSPDGTHVAYLRKKSFADEFQAMDWDSKTRTEVPVTEWSNRGLFVTDWSSDGKWLLASVQNPETGQEEIWKLRASGVHAKEDALKIVSSDPGCDLWQGRLSSDGRWVVFEAVRSIPTRFESAIYTVPTAGGPWIRITDGKHWDDKPRWSPDGKSIYFLSERAGFFNVFGIHFDALQGKPVGEVFQVTEFKDANLMIARSISTVGLSLTQDLLLVTVAQGSGSIWVLDNVDR